MRALLVMRQWLCVCIEEESIDIRTWLFTDHLGPDPGHITTQTNGFQAVSFSSIWLGSEWWKTQSFDLTTIIPRNTFRNGLLKIIILQTLLHFVTCYGSLMLALWCNVQDTTDFHNIELSSGISTTNKILKITDISSVWVYAVKYSARWVETVFFLTLNYKYILLQH